MASGVEDTHDGGCLAGDFFKVFGHNGVAFLEGSLDPRNVLFLGDLLFFEFSVDFFNVCKDFF